jgi:hypothetical protein
MAKRKADVDEISALERVIVAAWDERQECAGTPADERARLRVRVVQLAAKLATQLRREHEEHT